LLAVEMAKIAGSPVILHL